MHLLERYSKAASGAKIGDPFIMEDYFPLPFDNKYIHIHVSAGLPSKMYDYWEEVISLLSPMLAKRKILIVQTGAKDDKPIQGAFQLQGIANVRQTAFLIKNSVLHLSGNTFSAHLAGAYNIPYVVLYGVMPIVCARPYWGNGVCLSPDFSRRLPTYSAEENPKRINEILPETVVQHAVELLKWEEKVTRKSLYFGQFYKTAMLEVIPNFVLSNDMYPNQKLNVRCDYFPDTTYLPYVAAHGRELNIIADEPINFDVIQSLKKSIKMIHFKMEEFPDMSYFDKIKELGIVVRLGTKLRGEELFKVRLDLCDYEIIETLDATKKPEKLEISPDTQFASNKLLLASGQFFLSKAHYRADRPSENLFDTIIDSDLFWEELDFFYLFNGIA